MRSMTVEQVKQLRQTGVDIRDENGRRFIPRTVKTEVPVEEEKRPEPVEPADYTGQILSMIQDNAANIQQIAQLNIAVASALQEVAKPKKPKSWRCTVGRNGGKISTIDIVEK